LNDRHGRGCHGLPVVPGRSTARDVPQWFDDFEPHTDFSVIIWIRATSIKWPMLPGDVLFTGTPPGVAMARKPQEFLQPGTTLVSEIEGIGRLANPVVAGPGYPPSAG